MKTGTIPQSAPSPLLTKEGLGEVGRSSRSELARKQFRQLEGKPTFLADWVDAVFIHYQVNPAALQECVPFEPDLFEGSAYVSLVAFFQRRFRPSFAGPQMSWLGSVFANHAFLNFRTYVRYHDEAGIYFIAEWVPNLLATWIGPRMYGFPYRLGRLEYHHDAECGNSWGRVDANDSFEYRAEVDSSLEFNSCAPGSLDEFLMERYTAFTQRGRKQRLFRIWHEPWALTPLHIQIGCDDLLKNAGAKWFLNAEPAGAHFSFGVKNVWIGRPHHILKGNVAHALLHQK